MNKQYDGEWITKDLNDSIVINLVDKSMNLYSSYEAVDLINVVGDDIRIGIANINDLTNLLLYGVMRFKSLNNANEYIDIPLKNIYKLYENANIMKLYKDKLEIPNKTKKVSDLEAFSVIKNGEVLNDNYSFITTIISNPSEELEKLLKISKDFGKMNMTEKYNALTKIDLFNHKREKDR